MSFWLGAILGFFLGELAMSGVLVLLAARVRRQHVEPPAGLEDEVGRVATCITTRVAATSQAKFTQILNAESQDWRKQKRAWWN